MERQKAVQIARALESIDSFEAFADNVLQVVADWDDNLNSVSFVSRLADLLNEELAKRKKVLEEL